MRKHRGIFSFRSSLSSRKAVEPSHASAWSLAAVALFHQKGRPSLFRISAKNRSTSCRSGPFPTVVIEIGDRRVDLINLKTLDFREFVETSCCSSHCCSFFSPNIVLAVLRGFIPFAPSAFFRSPENQTQGVGSCEFVFDQIQITDYWTVLWKTRVELLI